jgi:mxaL protein
MKGVYWSMRTAKEVAGRPSLIFLTDGQEAPPIDPSYPPQMFEDLKAGEVHGWLMGTGGAAPKRIPRTDDEGRRIGYWQSYDVLQRFGAGTADNPSAQPREHLSGLREAHLKTLAKQVGFDYARLESQNSISIAMQDSRFAQRARAPTDISGWLAAAALALLALRFVPRPRLRPALGQLPHKP